MEKKKTSSLQQWQARFERWPVTGSVIRWLKRTSPPGFMGLSLYEILVFIYHELNNHQISTRANSMAFSFFLSLFPSLIVLFTLVAYLPIHKNYNDVIQLYINEVMPGNAGKVVQGFIKDITTKPRGGLLSVGFVLTIYFSSNGILAMIEGFEKSYKATFHRRNFLVKRWKAILLTILLGLMLVASFLLVIFGNIILSWLFNFLHLGILLAVLLFLLRWLVIVSLVYWGISLIYRIGAPTRERFDWMTPGSVLATFLSLLSSVGFSFYVENFGNYNKLYGSIGSLIVLMLWIQLNAFILLIGFELNAAIIINKHLKNLPSENRAEGR